MNLQSVGDLRPNWMKEIADLVTSLTGIQLGEQQRAMLESRLQKRMRDLRIADAESYLEYIRSHLDSEGGHLISLLTTHHTFFFREFSHFEYLGKEVLPKIIPRIRESGRKNVRVWSAACSQGQEVYSLAMYFFQHLKQLASDFTFEINGTDVDPDSIKKAKNGVYRWHDVKEIPLVYLWKHWARGTGDIKDYVKAKQTLKQYCKFDVQNLMQLPEAKFWQEYDVVFCRNVFIYFTAEQIRSVATQLLKYLAPHGHLFIGTSESLMNLKLPITTVAPCIYTKAASAPSLKVSTTQATKSKSTDTKPVSLRPEVMAEPRTAPLRKTRVLCVDDSSSIITLLKRILVDEFEIVGVAKNGLEAKELASKTKFDVMTLDIHMPGQSGIEYLKQNMNSSHPPVVMISSVPREDSQLAFECLQLGANDYIEKPTLNNLATRVDEIRTKIRCAAMVGNIKTESSQIDRSFHTQFKISDVAKKFRVIVCAAGDREKLATIGAELPGEQPPTVIFLEGATGILPAMADNFSKKLSKNAEAINQDLPELKSNTTYFAEIETHFDAVKLRYSGRATSFIVLGDVSKETLLKINGWPEAHIILEDLEVELSQNHKALMKRAKYFVPYTSMAYHSNEFLSKAGKNAK